MGVKASYVGVGCVLHCYVCEVESVRVRFFEFRAIEHVFYGLDILAFGDFPVLVETVIFRNGNVISARFEYSG